MTTEAPERTVLPPEEPLDRLVELLSRTGAQPVTTISGPNGEQLVLPAEVFEVLRDVVEAMSRGQAVAIAPVHQRLTTQEAADMLGVSRPTLVKLLESGEIPFEQPGRHRRVRLVDVLEYRDRSSVRRREALDRMVEIADESGMYERTVEPKRTR
jgi:excisionase family DNA binding protein